jgi:dTDP-4-dehydrorhamnose reductase
VKVLILGASGMIGSTMLRVISENKAWKVVGSVRSETAKDKLPTMLKSRLISGIDLANVDHLSRMFVEVKPEVVVNCVGLTKHLPGGNEPIPALTLNALLPHRLAALCSLAGARLIHISTDCVFSGKTGMYREDDHPDATDVYGKTKHLGEVVGENMVTLRTSTIGHEIGTSFGLLEWFLGQQECKGYRRAVFSGLPTVEFARVVRDIVIPNPGLSGLYHVGASPIDKDSLLRLIAKEYRKSIAIVTDNEVNIDRSLNVEKFKNSTGYCAPDWSALIASMHQSNT